MIAYTTPNTTKNLTSKSQESLQSACNLQEKSVDVLLSEVQTEILPDAGYDGMSKVTVSHSPVENETEIEITSSGEHIIHPSEGYDATMAVKANVNIQPNIISLGRTLKENGDYRYDAFDYGGQDGFNPVVLKVAVEPKLETRTIDITDNGTYTVYTSDGFDGLKSVNVNAKIKYSLKERYVNFQNAPLCQADIDKFTDWEYALQPYKFFNATLYTDITFPENAFTVFEDKFYGIADRFMYSASLPDYTITLPDTITFEGVTDFLNGFRYRKIHLPERSGDYAYLPFLPDIQSISNTFYGTILVNNNVINITGELQNLDGSFRDADWSGVQLKLNVEKLRSEEHQAFKNFKVGDLILKGLTKTVDLSTCTLYNANSLLMYLGTPESEATIALKADTYANTSSELIQQAEANGWTITSV